MTIANYFGRLCSFLIRRFAIASLTALTFSLLAFCGTIHEAAKAGNINSIKALIKENPSLVHSKDSEGLTPLYSAALWGRKDVVELLLANKADVNAKAGDGTTPLYAVVLRGFKNIAKILLANKANVNVKTSDGSSPLHSAVMNQYRDIAKLLLDYGADVNAKDNLGRTPLYDAAFSTSPGEFLNLEKSPEKIPPDAILWRREMTRIRIGIIQLLLDHGADANAKINDGMTPLRIAAQLGRTDIVELLRQHGGHE